MAKIVSAALKAQATGPRSQGHKVWHRGASRPRPSLEDYIADYCCERCLNLSTVVWLRLEHVLWTGGLFFDPVSFQQSI